jgi:hypothetical protein
MATENLWKARMEYRIRPVERERVCVWFRFASTPGVLKSKGSGVPLFVKAADSGLPPLMPIDLRPASAAVLPLAAAVLLHPDLDPRPWYWISHPTGRCGVVEVAGAEPACPPAFVYISLCGMSYSGCSCMPSFYPRSSCSSMP